MTTQTLQMGGSVAPLRFSEAVERQARTLGASYILRHRGADYAVCVPHRDIPEPILKLFAELAGERVLELQPAGD